MKHREKDITWTRKESGHFNPLHVITFFLLRLKLVSIRDGASLQYFNAREHATFKLVHHILVREILPECAVLL